MALALKKVSDSLGLPPGEHSFLVGKDLAGSSAPWLDLMRTHFYPGGLEQGVG